MSVVVAEEVAVDLIARIDKLEAGLKAGGRSVDNQLGRMESRAQAFSSRFGAYLGGFALGVTLRQLAEFSDQAKQMESQLRLATDAFGNFGQAQDDVRRIADVTRASLEATTKLYAGFVRASKETGRTQDDAARATQTFAEALKIGGASAEEAAAATLQFNQGLQSGVLRGDEFNSVLEASPRVARLLSDALGVSIGQLRGMAEQGKITSGVLFTALTDRKFTAGIDAEFKQVPVTFGDAMQAVKNAAVTTIGEFDKGGQFSNAIVNFLGTGTDTFAGLTRNAQQFGVDTRAVFDGLGNVFEPLRINADNVFASLGIHIASAKDQIASLLSGYDQFRKFVVDAGNLPTRASNALKSLDNGRYDNLKPPGSGPQPLRPYERSAQQAFLDGYNRSQAAASARARIQAAPSRSTAYVPSRSSAATPKKTRTSRGASSATSDVIDAAEVVKGIRADLERITRDTGGYLLSDADKLRASAKAFQDVFGDQADPFAESTASYEKMIRQEVDAKGELRQADYEAGVENTRKLAFLFEDLFQGGTDAVWRDFKDQGFRAIAELLAKAAITSFSKGGGGFGGLLSSLAGAVTGALGIGGGNQALGASISAGSSHALDFLSTPGFATGGSMRIGGVPGVDRNLLSLNGQPMARVSAGEVLNIGTAAANVRANPPGGAITKVYQINVSADHSVTPAGFAKGLASDILREAQRMDMETAKGTLRAAPGYLAKSQKLGQPKTI